MKFAFLSHVLPPSWSGQAVMIERILRGINADNYFLISSQNYEENSTEKDFIRRLPARYYHVTAASSIFGKRLLAIKWIIAAIAITRRAWIISRILKAERCNALVAGTGDVIDLPAACLAAHLARIPFYPHLFDDYAYQWSDPSIRSITKRLEPVIMRRSTGVILPNEFLHHEINRRYGINSVIVRNPCESDDVNNNERENLDIRNDECTIVYTGAVYDVNFGAFQNLLTAMKHPGTDSARLHLYTAQPLQSLKNAGVSGSNVIFHQHVPPEEVVKAQNSADILFIPFAFDSQIPEVIKTSAPGKLGDYLASGTPILAHVPHNSFVSWYLKKHNCGVVVDENGPQALSRAIQRLSSDIELRKTLSRNARRQAGEDFIPEFATRNFLSALGLQK